LTTPLAIGLVVLLIAIFIGLYLLITTLLGALSGVGGLARRFPDRDEMPRVELKGQSGAMGLGVQLRNVLTLAACPSGLRVTVWRAVAPFSKPFLVPWAEIHASPKKALLIELTRLGFGAPEAGSLTIAARLWQRLSSGDARSRASDDP
jgi:hypothetical protein